jgi:hypothetical protein
LRDFSNVRVGSFRRRFRLFGVGVVVLAGVGTAEAMRPSVPCSLDFVSERPVRGGSVILIGWAEDPAYHAPVERMDVWLDGSTRGDVLLAGHRPDVAAHFGRPEYLWSGWTATVSLRDVEPGLHRVEVIAESRNGERFSCGARRLEVRPFARGGDPPSWRVGLVLLARVGAFLGWLAFVGWGPMRMIGGRAVRLAPAIGLSLFAVASEAGGAANVRPLAAALLLTAVSAILLAVSTRRHGIRLRRPGPVATAVFAIATIFAVVGSIPLVRHGPGAVLGSISDATWECAVADSIARYGWTIPADVHGLLATVPSVWRAADFRPGVPYPLALLAQVFGVRAHEVHALLTIAIGMLVIFGVAALADVLLRRTRWIRVVVVGLVAANSVLFAQLYHQHTGILIATVLYLSFVYGLIALLPLRPIAFIVPVGLLLASTWTLYPETIVLWVASAGLLLVLSGTWKAVGGMVVRLGLAVVLAAALNPVGLARTVRFTNALRNASALATPQLRTVFGDTHYFPSAAVMTGLRPYRIDSPAPLGTPARLVTFVTALLLLSTAAFGLLRSRRRDWRLLLVLLAPVSLWLFLNRQWEFPYGYSKGLPHIVPVWSLAVGILVVRAGSSRAGRWGRLDATATVVLLAMVSILGPIEVVGRATRAVPGYDPAFRALPDLVAGIDRNAIIIVPEPLDSPREWIAYFLGEYRVVKTREEANSPPTVSSQPIYELVDRRSGSTIPASSVVRTSPSFALLRLR